MSESRRRRTESEREKVDGKNRMNKNEHGNKYNFIFILVGLLIALIILLIVLEWMLIML